MRSLVRRIVSDRMSAVFHTPMEVPGKRSSVENGISSDVGAVRQNLDQHQTVDQHVELPDTLGYVGVTVVQFGVHGRRAGDRFQGFSDPPPVVLELVRLGQNAGMPVDLDPADLPVAEAGRQHGIAADMVSAFLP